MCFILFHRNLYALLLVCVSIKLRLWGEKNCDVSEIKLEMGSGNSSTYLFPTEDLFESRPLTPTAVPEVFVVLRRQTPKQPDSPLNSSTTTVSSPRLSNSIHYPPIIRGHLVQVTETR